MSTNINRNLTELHSILCFVCYTQMLPCMGPLTVPAWMGLSPFTDGRGDLMRGSVGVETNGATIYGCAGCASNSYRTPLSHRE